MVCMLFLNNDAQQEKNSWKNTAQREYLKVEENVVQVRNSMGLEWGDKGEKGYQMWQGLHPTGLGDQKRCWFLSLGQWEAIEGF